MTGRPSGPGPGDLESLVGLRSVKGSHYAQFRGVEQRLTRVVGALERISRALVRTAEGPETLVLSVLDAAREHLGAQWVLFALSDGRLERTGPRHLMMDADGDVYAFEGAGSAGKPVGLPDEVLNRLNDVLRGQMTRLGRPIIEAHHIHVPVELNGEVVGGLSAWISQTHTIDPTDVVVLRILAGQATVALLNAALFEESRHLLVRAEQAYEESRRHAAHLAERNAELERTQRELSAAMRQEVLNTERARIARELHDSVAQSVLSAGVQIEVCRIDADPAIADRLAVAGKLTKDAVEQVRSVIYTLNHAPSDRAGDLAAILEELCSMHMPDDLRTDVRVIGRQRDLAHDVQHAILRIAGEALFNTAVHAQATNARVVLFYSESDVRLTVDDDGSGDPEYMRRVMRAATVGDLAGRHHGLANMRSRAVELSGDLRIRRSRLGGVRIVVEIPTTDRVDR
ncbi:signal transduction histidine kinase [Williamsia muralis]|uniref:histidine kinase n=1 Tax=Williamsia marianensis TaxID=85044 RepID=A0A495K565_WILMA|nr:histidine kinase [Williamsia muralis]RKR95975.1 signal transduction histidine kinase [Williamsia muralis]